VACPALQYFFTLSRKRHDLLKEKVLIFFLQLLSETFVMLRRIQRHNIIHVRAFSCLLLVILVRFLRTLNFLGKFSKNNIKFDEYLSSGSRVVPYGRTYMTKLTVAFRNFAKAPKTQNGNVY
jgi:hypothetical protein